MTDPFEPYWTLHSNYDWHAYDASGDGTFFKECPVAVDAGWWGVPDIDGNTGDAYSSFVGLDMTGLDWRNSLRHRPEPPAQ